MKTKLAVTLIVVVILTLSSGFLFCNIPAIYPSTVSTFSEAVSTLGMTIPANVEAAKNFGTSINITGNIRVTGNNITYLGGLSVAARARVFLNGSIEVEGNGTLVLQYITLYLVGGKKPYDRYIRLSNPANGYPRLKILNATIVASSILKSWKVISKTAKYADVSAGCAIYAWNNSEISGKELAFYRPQPYYFNLTAGGPNVIECRDESSVNLSYLVTESISARDNARVFVSIGKGASKAVIGASVKDKGIFFDVGDFSSVEFYGVDLCNSILHGNASLSLKWCGVIYANSLRVSDFARLYVSAGSDFIGGLFDAPLAAPLVVGGNSRVVFNESLIQSTPKDYVAAVVMDNATFSANNASIVGTMVGYGRSSILLNNMKGMISARAGSSYGALETVRLAAHDFSNISLSDCVFSTAFSPHRVELYDNSRLYCSRSNVIYSWIAFYNNSLSYFSDSSLSGCQLYAEDTSNAAFANCSIGNSLELRDSSSVFIRSSSSMAVHGLKTSHLFVINSSVSVLYAKDSSETVALNSTINELSFAANNVNGSWTGLTSFFENSSLTLVGQCPKVALSKTYVRGVDLLLFGRSSVSVSNSTLRNVNLGGSSIASLYNVSIIVPIESISVVGTAKVYVYSNLRVRTVDQMGNPLSGANASIYRAEGTNATRLARRLTDENGFASFLLFSELVNASGRFAFGDVEVRTRFSGISVSQFTRLVATNKDVTVVYPLPSWYGYILPAVVIVAIVLILYVLSFVIKKIRTRER